MIASFFVISCYICCGSCCCCCRRCCIQRQTGRNGTTGFMARFYLSIRWRPWRRPIDHQRSALIDSCFVCCCCCCDSCCFYYCIRGRPCFLEFQSSVWNRHPAISRVVRPSTTSCVSTAVRKTSRRRSSRINFFIVIQAPAVRLPELSIAL